MDLEYRLFDIGWDGSTHRGESWGKNSIRRVARILCLSSLAKFDFVYIIIFMSVNQTNACMYVLYCDIIAIKEDCCWLFFFFFKLSTHFNLILYSKN